MYRRKIFIVDYIIQYGSGKQYREKKQVYALTKFGAESCLLWLKSRYGLDIIVLSVTDTGKYVGRPIQEDRSIFGDF